MWNDTGKLKIAGKTLDYHQIIDSAAGPERIVLVFPDNSELMLEWGMEVEGQSDMHEIELVNITKKSEAHKIFHQIRKMLESCAEGKIFRDTDF